MTKNPYTERIAKILFKLRTTREVEHNDSQWTTEFVYSLDKATTALTQLLDEVRVDELMKLNGLVTASEFHVPSRHKVYDYIARRKDQLQPISSERTK